MRPTSEIPRRQPHTLRDPSAGSASPGSHSPLQGHGRRGGGEVFGAGGSIAAVPGPPGRGRDAGPLVGTSRECVQVSILICTMVKVYFFSED